MSNNGLTVTVASDPTLYYPEGFRIIVYGTVILVGRTQEIKVGVDPLAIILSGPLGKFVLHPYDSGLSISLLTEKEVLPERIPLTSQLPLALSKYQ